MSAKYVVRLYFSKESVLHSEWVFLAGFQKRRGKNPRVLVSLLSSAVLPKMFLFKFTARRAGVKAMRANRMIEQIGVYDICEEMV